MGASGLIVVVIVAAWALFLVPQWMHKRAAAAAHLADRVPDGAADDEGATSRARRRGRFGQRLVARRSTTTDEESVRRWRLPALPSLTRKRPSTDTETAENDWDTDESDSGWDTDEVGRNAVPAPSAAARRRRVLAGLAGLTLAAVALVAVASLAGIAVPAWVVAVPGGLMLAYLVLLAVVRPGARSADGSAQPGTAHPGTAHPGTAQTRVTRTSEATTGTPVRRNAALAAEASHAPDAAADGADHAASSTTGAVRAIASADPVAATTGASAPGTPESPRGESTWTPVPLPTPTYVTAPRARRSVRTIDLSNPGSWTTATGGPAAPREAAPSTVAAPAAHGGEASAALSASAGDQGDDMVVEHRRAVGD